MIAGAKDWHSHESGQFLFVERGVSHLRTTAGDWIVPARRVTWIPPRVPHASGPSAGRGWVILAAVELSGAPRSVCTLSASALMTAALRRLARIAPQDGLLERLLWQLVEAEMGQAEPEALSVPMPASPRMLVAAESVLERPHMSATIDRLAARAGMSRRSFTRQFRGQTGLTYSRWKRAVLAQHALEKLAAGEKVASVAADLGYASVSAFIAMFRAQYGGSPRQFALEHAERLQSEH